jgi:hypothetical protein
MLKQPREEIIGQRSIMQGRVNRFQQSPTFIILVRDGADEKRDD